MKSIYASLAATAVLAACGTAPVDGSGKRVTLADVGPPPTNVEAAVADALRYKLKDFDSAKIELRAKPRPVVIARVAGFGNGGAGWEICPMVNAKNSYGAYTGFKPVFILWRDGQVIDLMIAEGADVACSDRNSLRLEVGPRL